MPKSRNRKNHKKKVQAFKERRKAKENQYMKAFQEALQKEMENKKGEENDQ